jgi:membrane-bound metal-dependent hydrolase YbcI (DUF457 family)
MFIGHYALALASKKNNKAPSLAMLFIAVQFLDLLWPIFVLLGLESFQIEVGNTKLIPLSFTHYPYSHSLLMTLFWGMLLGLIYYLVTKHKNASLLLFALVCSHWVLDLITHRTDLPLTPFGDFKMGLGLWNYPILETIIEVGLYITGVILYYKFGNPKRNIMFWSLVSVLLIIHVMNILGPPPPSTMAVAWAANLSWLFVLWAWWIEKAK